MIPRPVLLAAVAQFCTPADIAAVHVAGGHFARLADRSQLLLNRNGGGGTDGWHWWHDSRGISFGLRPFSADLHWSAPAIVAAVLTVNPDTDHAAAVAAIVDVLTADELVQLDLFGGVA